MHSVGKFLNWFRTLRLLGWQIGGDEGYGHHLMDRLAELDFHLHRVNNGSQAKLNDIYANLSAEWWSTVGQLVERRMIRIPNDEKLIAQLTSRRKLYDSRGREKLESKADLASRGVESPDRSDALIGAVMMGIRGDPYALNPRAHRTLLEMMQELIPPPRGGPLAGGTDPVLRQGGLSRQRRRDKEVAFCLPALRSLGELADRASVIVVDTREQDPLVFERLASMRGTLQTGDYSVVGLQDLFSIERKTVSDLVGCCMRQNLERFERELHRLRGYRVKRLLVVGKGGDPLGPVSLEHQPQGRAGDRVLLRGTVRSPGRIGATR
jgi:hypothetical protein